MTLACCIVSMALLVMSCLSELFSLIVMTSFEIISWCYLSSSQDVLKSGDPCNCWYFGVDAEEKIGYL